MKNKIVYILLICLFLIGLIVVLGGQGVSEQVEEEDQSAIIVTDFSVNGETGQVFLNLDDESIITAVIANEGSSEKEVVMTVKMDGETFDGRHTWSYSINPGEIKEIEEVREVHHTWYEGSFTVELMGDVIEVIVE